MIGGPLLGALAARRQEVEGACALLADLAALHGMPATSARAMSAAAVEDLVERALTEGSAAALDRAALRRVGEAVAATRGWTEGAALAPGCPWPEVEFRADPRAGALPVAEQRLRLQAQERAALDDCAAVAGAVLLFALAHGEPVADVEGVLLRVLTTGPGRVLDRDALRRLWTRGPARRAA